MRPKATKIVSSTIELKAQGKTIPGEASIRLLVLRIQADWHNMELIRLLGAKVYQVTRLITRILNKKYGMKEKGLIRLVQAFVVSRIAYVPPFKRLGVAEKVKMKAMIRKLYKRALGLPDSTANIKLEALGVTNTLDEIVEAQRTAQLERLTKSETGRRILRTLGIGYERQGGEMVDLPSEVRSNLQIQPLPKHMRLGADEGRRLARAKALGKLLKDRKDVAYVDVAEYNGLDCMVALAVDGEEQPRNSCTVKRARVEDAEEAAIALALGLSWVKAIVSDSQRAIRNYARG